MLLVSKWRRGGNLFSVNEYSLLLQRRRIRSDSHLSSSAPTAGILVIGDEILKGQVRDTNSHFIMSRLYQLGFRVMRVSVVGDDINAISDEVQKFSQLFSYVITSGGIGPTHDDVTFEGIAKAFKESMMPHPELLKLYAKFYKTTEQNPSVLKLASVPESAKLSFRINPDHAKQCTFPNICVKNVYIFPGVPLFLEKSFTMLCEDIFGGSGTKFYHTDLYLSCDEVFIAEQLSAVAREFPDVNFGSYPQFDQSYFGVKLTIESDKMDTLTKALCRLQDVLPQDCIVNYDPTSLTSSYNKILLLSSQKTMHHTGKALQDALQAISQFRQNKQVLFLDASPRGIAALHIIHAVLEKLNILKQDIPVILLHEGEDSYMSIKYFHETIFRYSLNVKAGPYDLQSAILHLKSMCPDLTLLIVGTQFTTVTFQESLNLHFGANKVSVLAPVSTWHDIQVFEFIHSLSLPYKML